MSKSVLVVSSSLRNNANSEILAMKAYKGAKDAGHNVDYVTLKNKDLKFCKGCLACQRTLKCIINDDGNEIIEKIKNAEVIIFCNPIYYYNLCGQLKTLLDRCNPLFNDDYKFRDIYLITTAADNYPSAADSTVKALMGWIDCFPNAKFKTFLNAGGVNEPAEINQHPQLIEDAYNLSANV